MSTNSNIPLTNPPVLERVLFVSAKIESSVFDERRDRFLEVLKDLFPIADDRYLPETQLKFDNRSGKSQIIAERIRVEYVRWRNDRKRFSVTFSREKLHFNLIRKKDDFGSFEEIYSVAEKIIPKWMQIFEISGNVSVSVQYMNDPTRGKKITGKITPSEYVTFAPNVRCQKLDGKVEDLYPPWKVQFSLPVTEGKKDLITIDSTVEVRNDRLSFLVFFVYRLALQNADTNDILNGFQVGHEIILNSFDIYLTDSAKGIKQ